MEKTFAQMTSLEFAALKRKAIHSESIMPPRFSDNKFEDFKIPENYFEDSITPKRKKEDEIRFCRDSYLSNGELMEKIHAQLKEEKESRRMEFPVMAWGKLLQTKIFSR